MTRRQFVASSGATALPAFAATRKPNILFMLAEDLGYADLGANPRYAVIDAGYADGNGSAGHLGIRSFTRAR